MNWGLVLPPFLFSDSQISPYFKYLPNDKTGRFHTQSRVFLQNFLALNAFKLLICSSLNYIDNLQFSSSNVN